MKKGTTSSSEVVPFFGGRNSDPEKTGGVFAQHQGAAVVVQVGGEGADQFQSLAVGEMVAGRWPVGAPEEAFGAQPFEQGGEEAEAARAVEIPGGGRCGVEGGGFDEEVGQVPVGE